MECNTFCVRAVVITVLLNAVSQVLAEEAKPLPGTSEKSATAASQNAVVRGEIEKVFRAQQEAWNRGDIDGFMEGYWKSDDLTFNSGGKTTRGWKATLAHYKEAYSTRESMGRLALSGFEITPLCDSAAMVLGQWKLERQNEPVGGNFTLVLRKIDGRWVIVHDHTSRLEE